MTLVYKLFGIGIALLFIGGAIGTYLGTRVSYGQESGVQIIYTRQANDDRPLPIGVIRYLDGFKNLDGTKVWQSFSVSEQDNFKAEGGSLDDVAGIYADMRLRGESVTDITVQDSYHGDKDNYLVVAHVKLRPDNAPIELIFYLTTDKQGLIDHISS